jgi:antitoxin (DNA-binding transcriptional repressor) of toxin-antitoxin stability system
LIAKAGKPLVKVVPLDTPSAPERLADRIEALFTLPDLEERVAVRERLILDTLALLPETPDVERARSNLERLGGTPPA